MRFSNLQAQNISICPTTILLIFDWKKIYCLNTFWENKQTNKNQPQNCCIMSFIFVDLGVILTHTTRG